MTVESERLQLKPFSIRLDEHGRKLIERPATGGLLTDPIPERFLPLFEQTIEGSSPSQMVRFLKAGSTTSGRFNLIARYLCYLNEIGLLADPRAVHLAESLRPDYSWRTSIAFEEIFYFQIFRANGHLGAPKAFRSALVTIFVALGVGSIAAWIYAIATQANGGELFRLTGPFQSSGPFLIGFLIAFCLSRSLASIFLFLAIHFVGGSEARLGLRADCVSLALATDDPSTVRPSGPLIWSAIGCAGLLSSAAAFALLFPSDPSWSFVPNFVALVLLVDLSPFRRSPLTEILRAIYNHQDTRNEESVRKHSPEKFIARAQALASVAWIVGCALFLVGPARWIIHAFMNVRAPFTPGSLPATLAFLLACGLVIISFLDDVAGAKLTQSSENARKLWRRRQPPVRIDEAIARGLSPEDLDFNQLPLLRQMGREVREELLKNSEVLVLKPGEAACRQGETNRDLFIVLSGKLAVAKRLGAQPQKRRRIVALLESGSVFGEVAFFLARPRTADVVALEESRVLRIGYDPRINSLDPAKSPAKSEELQFRVWFLQVLVSNATWKELPSEALDALLIAGRKVTFKAGEKVISEGEMADACYFLIQGRASVVQKTVHIRAVKTGDVFGEIALLNPESLRTATIIAETDLLAVRIETERFWHLAGTHFPLGLEVERIALKRLRADQQRQSFATSASGPASR